MSADADADADADAEAETGCRRRGRRDADVRLLHRSPVADVHGGVRAGIRLHAGDDLVERERAEDAQQIDDPLRPLDPAVGGQALQFGLGTLDDRGVEQFAQFRAAEQLREQARIERQRGGAAFSEGASRPRT